MTLDYDENSLEQEFERYAAVLRAIEDTTESKMASELFQAIAASKNVVDGLKTLSAYANEIKDVTKRGEFMKVIGELSLELAETQIKLAEQLREVDALKQQVSQLEKENKKLRDPEETLHIKNGLYYKPDDDGPFCTACYDKDRKSIRVTALSGDFRFLGEYKCPVCNTVYGKASRR